MKCTIRNLAAWSVANGMILSGLVRRKIKNLLSTECITTICFHNPSQKEFEYCISWLRNKKFTFLSIADVDNLVEHDLPLPKGGVLLTVDDGWQSNEINVAELANKYQVPVTIFVSTSPVEEGAYWWSYIRKAANQGLKPPCLETMKNLSNGKRLEILNQIRKSVSLEREAFTVDQVRRVASSKFITIGAHTHTHPILINCNSEQVYDELKLSKEKLEKWIGREVPFFAYPNGDYSRREVELLSMLNYRLAFTCQPGYLTDDIREARYELPRFGFLEGASKAENVCRMTGLWKLMSQNAKQRLRFKKDKVFDGKKKPEVGINT